MTGAVCAGVSLPKGGVEDPTMPPRQVAKADANRHTNGRGGPVKISCLCPTYNRGSGKLNLLQEAVECFRRQDNPDRELIIGNDTPGADPTVQSARRAGDQLRTQVPHVDGQNQRDDRTGRGGPDV